MTSIAPRFGYAPVNGLRLYYEIDGQQRDGQVPLVVLHGSFMTIELMGGLVPALTPAEPSPPAPLPLAGEGLGVRASPCRQREKGDE